jgi:SAM-dependent methyltransferase
MRIGFVSHVYSALLDDGTLARTARVLSVAGGTSERDLFTAIGLNNAVISNLDTIEASAQLEPFEWAHQDAQHLSYGDKSFDWVVVVDGLHHCTSPHRALTEMYRVCRIGVIVVEARDSALMRLAVRTGMSSEYELEAVIHQEGRSGGLENGPVPNHVYRWTEAEFEKTIRSCDPTGDHKFRYFNGLNLPYETAALRGWGRKAVLLKVADPLMRLFTAIFKKQCNSIAMVATRPETLWPWLEQVDGDLEFRNPLRSGEAGDR